MLKWYEESADNSDVVVSSRIRLARNLSKYPFSPKLSKSQSKEMIKELESELSFPISSERPLHWIQVNTLSDIDKVALVERHLISETLAAKEDATAAMISDDEVVSIMLNEEDHIRIQTMSGGMNLEKAFSIADAIDDEINKKFAYAYHERLGYLTTFPTNVGTGLRVSYMLHLPGIARTKKLASISSDIGRFGVTIRGMSNDKENGIGNLYQIYNQKTLGRDEKELIQELGTIANQIIKQERRVRNKMMQDNKNLLEDTLLRSYGLLKYCKSLEIEEGMNLLSNVQLGITTGIIQLDADENFNIYSLVMGIQPAHLEKEKNRALKKEERDILRAEYVQKHLPDILK
ncbi:MAG: protein arginine kinase [Lachnospiraceae bacterium]|jgi:protein arginine kinase|nr:protein arginine kinase [Lachnospiraceae bacterium]